MNHAEIHSLYRLYQSGKGLGECVKKRQSKVSRQMLWYNFKQLGLNTRPKIVGNYIEYNGKKYYPSKGGYFRCGVGDRHQLHRKMWEDAYGSIPLNHEVRFKDGNNKNISLDNMECLPKRESVLKTHPKQPQPVKFCYCGKQIKGRNPDYVAKRTYCSRECAYNKLWRDK